MPNAFVNVLSDNRTLALPVPASQAISIGDICYWDATNKLAKPVTLLTTGASEVNDQQQVASQFLGIALDARLSTETDTTATRLFLIDGICDFPCPSQTFKLGDMIGATWNGGSALVATAVTLAPNLYTAIGRVVNPVPGNTTPAYGTATTTVRARIQSRVAWDLLNSAVANMAGAQQTLGPTTLTDAPQTLTLSTSQILNMVPTAARNVTLPLETVSKGMEFVFTNNSAGAFSVTFLASGGGGIKGNGVCPQNKTALLWCDGTNWNGMISA